MKKTKFERGFYQISITNIKSLIKNCIYCGYGNKDTCKDVAETVLGDMSIKIDTEEYHYLFHRLVEIVHDINNGGSHKKELLIPMYKTI